MYRILKGHNFEFIPIFFLFIFPFSFFFHDHNISFPKTPDFSFILPAEKHSPLEHINNNCTDILLLED